MKLFRSGFDTGKFMVHMANGKLAVSYKLTDEKEILIVTGRINRYPHPLWKLEGEKKDVLTFICDGAMPVQIVEFKKNFEDMVTA